MLERQIRELVDTIGDNLVAEIESGVSSTIKMVLDVYNHNEENYHEGVDYIFDLNNPKDLKSCIDGGLTASEIAQIYQKTTEDKEATGLFFFGVNHETPELITKSQLRQQLVSPERMNSIVYSVICYPYYFQELYQHCITDKLC